MAFSFDLTLGNFHLGFKPEARTTLKTPSNWMYGWGAETDSGERVNETSALKLAAVFTCLNVIGKDIGSIPFSVRQDVTNSDEITRKRVVKESRVHHLVHSQPNPYMTALVWRGASIRQVESWGNSYSIISAIHSHWSLTASILPILGIGP